MPHSKTKFALVRLYPVPRDLDLWALLFHPGDKPEVTDGGHLWEEMLQLNSKSRPIITPEGTAVFQATF